MTLADASGMMTQELVDQFESIALEQDEALLLGEFARYNKLFRRMSEIKLELKHREGDQRHRLIALLNHKNAQVRLKAAISVLALAPDEARSTLQKISDRNEYPQAADARGIIQAIDEGSYTPS